MPALNNFPLELLKLIASELLSTADVYAFSQVCTTFHAAVYSDQTVWRALFLHVFEVPAATRGKRVGVPYDWRSSFQQRHRVLARDIKTLRFEDATQEPQSEREALEVIRDMVLDAVPSSSSSSPRPTSRNLEYLEDTLPPSFLNPSCPTVRRPLLSLLRLLLHPLRPTPEQYEIPPLQHLVYSNTYSTTDPSVSLAMFEAMASLFAYHIKGKEAHTFYQSSMLNPDELPAFWRGSIGKEEDYINAKTDRMETRWFGAYLAVAHQDVHHLASSPNVLLNETTDSHLVELHLTLPTTPTSSASSPSCSPPPMDIKSPPVPTTRRAITGHGKDYRSFTVPTGTVRSLPPVHGIPGWQSISFVKDYSTHRWVYDGIVLPGRNMMLGKWRHPQVALNNFGLEGIFCFWVVPQDCPDLSSRDNRVALRD